MKKIMIMFAVATLGFASCVQDTGNYDYAPVDDKYPAEFAEGSIEPEYPIMAGETLTIDPQYEGTVDDSDYTYLWYADLNADGKADTLGTSRVLEFAATVRPGSHALFLKVMHPENGVMRIYQTVMNVETQFSTGWFVTKETSGGMTDVDHLLYADETLLPEVIAMINGASLPGAPVKTAFVPLSNNGGGWEYDKGALEAMFLVASESDIHSFLASDMTQYYDTQEIFMGSPSTVAPEDVGCWSYALSHFTLLVSDKKLYLSSGSNALGTDGHSGQFASLYADKNLSVNGGGVCKVYDPDAFMNAHGVMFFFDDNTKTFKRIWVSSMPAAVGPSTLPILQDVGVAQDYDLVFMKEYNTAYGLGVLKSTVDGKFHAFSTKNIVSTALGSFADPFNTVEEIPAGSVTATGTVRTTHRTNTTIFSSTGNNEVWAYGVGLGRAEEKILTLPAGESVVFIDHIRDADLGFNHLVVLSNTASGYNMRCYDFVGQTAGLASPDPVKEYSGTGRAVHALYRGYTTGNPVF